MPSDIKISITADQSYAARAAASSTTETAAPAQTPAAAASAQKSTFEIVGDYLQGTDATGKTYAQRINENANRSAASRFAELAPVAVATATGTATGKIVSDR